MRSLLLPGASHILTGPRGIGKSTIVLGMVAAIALGEDWHGLECTQANVLCLDAESGAPFRAEKIFRLFEDGFPADGRNSSSMMGRAMCTHMLTS